MPGGSSDGRNGSHPRAAPSISFARAMWREGRLLATYKDGTRAPQRLSRRLCLPARRAARAAAGALRRRGPRFRLQSSRMSCSSSSRMRRPAASSSPRATTSSSSSARSRGHDNATPSGNAVAAWGLGRLAAITGEERYARAAERTLELFYPQMRDYPAGFAAMTIALDEALQPPRTLILRGRGEALPAWQAELAQRVPAGCSPCSRCPTEPPACRGPARQAAASGACQRMAMPGRYLSCADQRSCTLERHASRRQA